MQSLHISVKTSTAEHRPPAIFPKQPVLSLLHRNDLDGWYFVRKLRYLFKKTSARLYPDKKTTHSLIQYRGCSHLVAQYRCVTLIFLFTGAATRNLLYLWHRLIGLWMSCLYTICCVIGHGSYRGIPGEILSKLVFNAFWITTTKSLAIYNADRIVKANHKKVLKGLS